jgi:hypothetical protein
MQHFAVWPEDYDATYEKALAAGFRVCQEGDLTGWGRFVYFANEDHPGTVVELSHFTPAWRSNDPGSGSKLGRQQSDKATLTGRERLTGASATAPAAPRSAQRP